MNFLAPKAAFAALALAAGLTVSVTSTATADAGSAHASHLNSTTTTAHQAAHAKKSAAVAQRSASVVFSVPSSFIKKQQAKCRRDFGHNKRLRKLCVRAQPALAMGAKYKVNNWRAANAIHTYKLNNRLAKKCKRNHKWCSHAKRLSHIGVSCGPFAPPRWHIVYSCLRLRAGVALNKYLQLKVFTTSTLSPKQVAKMKAALAKMGPKDNTHLKVSFGLSLWHGPYVNVIFSRTTTEAIYSKTRNVSDMAVVATMICAVVGSETADLVTPLCTGAAVLGLDDAKAKSGEAHDQGKCLALRVYALSPMMVGGISNPLGVSDCSTSKAALNRTLNRAERQAS